ncbi:hypothetical protein [Propioniciclava soli]|uniref:DUF5709 domain-containing protein n=1 Tax=Propioniciclava soli TaxID=2775081 RepID=A0ABZ3C5I0_9ACTN|nr:hypothetical protein [Propioniciclava soli]
MTGNHPESDALAAGVAANRRDTRDDGLIDDGRRDDAVRDDRGVIDGDTGFLNTDDTVADDRVDRDVEPGEDADLVARDRPDPSEGAVVDGVASDPLLNVVDGRPETVGVDPIDDHRGTTTTTRTTDRDVTTNPDLVAADPDLAANGRDLRATDRGNDGGATAAGYNQEQPRR